MGSPPTSSGRVTPDAPVTTVPYGGWASPITAELLVQGAAGISEVIVDGDDIWWNESRPEEGGRTALVRWRDGETTEPLGTDVNVRTGVHEYGGGAWWVADGVVWFVDWADQRLRRFDTTASGVEGGNTQPTVLTPEPLSPRGIRWADGRPTPDGQWFIAVRETHSEGADGEPHPEPTNEIVAVAADGSGDQRVLVSGPDFVSTPRVSPDGAHLCWIQWDHPNMPWDTTELWVARLTEAGVDDPRRVAGGHDESVLQPEWAPDGDLLVTSDRHEWWNLRRFAADGNFTTSVIEVDGAYEIATPQWVFNMTRHATGPSGTFAAASTGGGDLLVLPDGSTVDTWSAVSSLRAHGDGVVFVGATWSEEPGVHRVAADGTSRTIHRGRTSAGLGLGPEWTPDPEHITFPVGEGPDGSTLVAHALYHPPANPNHDGPEGERPPLLVKAHGGPTGAARTQMQLSTSFWTSRGFAVVDVNYRGSVGYGRTYRHSLDGQWGVADVVDCVAAARWLGHRGDVDADRLAIAGGSAGGFTVLAALTFHDVFAVGASRYGIADLAVLARDTHKFEARYLDRLVGPWPEDEPIYTARSPINHTRQLSCPMIILQGGEDKVVPPNQAELMVEALKEKGLAHRYLLFPEEGHGFRQADNIVAALNGELAFFGEILGFTPA